ncbi:MAG: SpoIIE family protein phosphatase [Culturomica sp.]|jgi:sigma-B regulation protein RsbU (phosphoserine phosphatase)|nr:SpoIIE family protein phosphatase [Culturomica sp.]
MENIEKIPKNVAWLLTKYVKPEEMISMSRNMIMENKEVLCCIIAFEPDYPKRNERHTVYSYVKDNNIISKEVPKSYDVYARRWYKYTKANKRPLWMRSNYEVPYVPPSAINYSVPLFKDDNTFIGVISFVLETEWLSQLVMPDKEYKGMYPFIVNSRGESILSGKRGRQMAINNINDILSTSNPKLNEVIKRIVALESGNSIVDIEGETCYVSYAPIEGTTWSLTYVIPYKEAFRNSLLFDNFILIAFIICIIIITTSCFIIIRRLTQPLRQTVDIAQAIIKGEVNAANLDEKTNNDEIDIIHNSFLYMQKRLKRYIDRIGKTEQSNKRIERDLKLAHNIQMGLLNKDFNYIIENSIIDFYAVTHPAIEVGGDFYDYSMKDDHLYFIVGDVSGKGVSGSIMMGVTISLFRGLNVHNMTPSQIATFLNKNICDYNEADMFVTIFIGKLNISKGHLTFCDAGHPAPIVEKNDGSIEFIKLESDLPLGINKSYVYHDYEYQFKKNEGILLYTDGVTDAQNPDNEFFREERLLQIVKDFKDLPIKDLINKIIEEINTHQNGSEQTDDFTIFAFSNKKAH